MDVLTTLSSALGLGMLAGIRLYATAFVVGLLLRLDWVALPAAWQHASVLADTRVLVFTGAACAIEFVADKIPWLDSAWDSIHTVIRPIGAALAASSLFSSLDPAYQVCLFILAGGVAFSGHSAKAATRMVANHSPEPFSNIALSVGEDLAVAGGLYLLVKHPWIMAGIALIFLAFFAWLAPRIFRAVRAQWAALGALLSCWLGQVRSPHLTPAQEQRFLARSGGRAPAAAFAVIATRDLKGMRNAVGTLCLNGPDALFFSRAWGRGVERELAPVAAIEPQKRLLVDDLVLISADGRRTRFGLLAGQLERARRETARYAPPSPSPQRR